jgi:glycogen debranching enzyme
MARPGIALCEVQGYVYEAKWLIAIAADALGKSDLAEALRAQAETLRQRFVEAFWSDELGTYALALDGDKQPCLVRSSNAGHCLFSGIADPSHANRIVEQLLGEEYFSGWGIRTIAQGEARYNPMSYHNGSVWPHDNSMIGYGMGRYGSKHAAAAVLTSLFEVSHHYELRRLPELFCGFERQAEQGPTFYPVACLPQAWAAGSVFLLLQACLGLEIDGVQRKLSFNASVLPAQLHKLTLYNLSVGDASIDVALQRTHDGIRVTVLRQQGEIDLVVT